MGLTLVADFETVMRAISLLFRAEATLCAGGSRKLRLVSEAQRVAPPRPERTEGAPPRPRA